jgi:hypothetical protein
MGLDSPQGFFRGAFVNGGRSKQRPYEAQGYKQLPATGRQRRAQQAAPLRPNRKGGAPYRPDGKGGRNKQRPYDRTAKAGAARGAATTGNFV